MSRVLTNSLTHAHAKCENRHLCSINDHFSKTKVFFFYKSKSIGQTPISTCFYQVPCVFVGSEFSGSHHRLRTPSNTFTNFHRWIHMSNQEHRVFHPRGYLSLLAIPNTCTHDIPSNTKHSVDLYHALTPMSCDVPCINAMQCHCMYLMLHAQ